MKTSSLLYHILTTSKESVTQHGVITLELSDHDLIFCTRKTKCFKSRNNTISGRTYKNYSQKLLEERLTKLKIPNYLLFSCADSVYNHLSKILQDTTNDIAPIKDIYTKPWFDNNMIGLIRKRNKLKKKLLNTKLHVDYEYIKEQQNIVQREIKRKKTNYVKEQLQKNTNNPKELWKALKNLGMPCQVSHQPKIFLRENNLLQFSEKKNANTFKDFCRNLAADLVNRLPAAKNIFGINSVKEYCSALNIPSDDSFKLESMNKQEVFKILSNVDPEKACGIDEIPCRMLKDGTEILVEPISQIVNMPLGSKFPGGCKTAKVRPIFKKGKNTEPKKYRSVSLLPVMSKVIERVVHNQLIQHLEKYKIIFDYQSGFRSKHSLNTYLTHLSNQILKGFEARKSTGMILIDLQKALDTLDHQILLKKLKYIGLSPEIVRWLESYLKNRNLIVNLEKSLSESGILNCGVPQGSILGHILFYCM